ncbi:MAG: iron-containing redox enzyme family protein [Deltaproteobacteria bacterium]|nr:iron-containing redox enzyme family protein [Deltaproteobacteria bacterium]
MPFVWSKTRTNPIFTIISCISSAKKGIIRISRRKFGFALGLTDEDFENALPIFECIAHTGAILRGMLLGSPPENRAGALVNETMVCRYSEEFDTYLDKHYALGEDARAFFIVHSKVDKEHTALAAKVIARYANSERDQYLVREAARNMVRFKIAKFEGIYKAYT